MMTYVLTVEIIATVQTINKQSRKACEVIIAISGAGFAYPSGAPVFIPVIREVVLLNFQFSVRCFVDHCLSFCQFFFFLVTVLSLAIVLSVLRYTASELITPLISSNLSLVVSQIPERTGRSGMEIDEKNNEVYAKPFFGSKPDPGTYRSIRDGNR